MPSPGEAWTVEIAWSVVDSKLGCQNYVAPLSLFQPAPNQLVHGGGQSYIDKGQQSNQDQNVKYLCFLSLSHNQNLILLEMNMVGPLFSVCVIFLKKKTSLMTTLQLPCDDEEKT